MLTCCIESWRIACASAAGVMTVASQAITASDDIPRASDCCGRRPARSPEIFPGIQMSPSLPGKFRNRLVNSQLTGCTTISKREESQEKECQESYANTAHPRKQAKFLSPTASNDLSRSVLECRSPCPQRIGPDVEMSRDGPGRRLQGSRAVAMPFAAHHAKAAKISSTALSWFP